ncbi:MAG: HAMP domain-containing histidine kinase [Elusimicrobia bacterium]|nr:HAMP domain-containing histidine kinase [Elusimicrobiota bacterium]
MRIQAKLALVISLTVAASVAAAGAAFVGLQKRALARAEAEKEALLLEGVRKVAAESLLGKDPLMLISYLTALRRDRPEVRACRVLLDGEWQAVGPAPARGDDAAPRLVEAAFAGPPASAAKVEVTLSKTLLVERERRESDALVRGVLRVGGLAVLAGLLLSFPLSATLTRRLVTIEAALDEIGHGRFASVPETRGSDEIARLARNVNVMSERLKELEEMKKLLVASVSHELRSPLGAIESKLKEILEKPSAVGDKERAGLQSIRKYASRLEHFVSSMLELSKIERGKLEYAPRVAELGPVVEDAAAFFEPKAREAGLTLEARVEPGLPAFSFDPDLTAQVLANLISNAIKFTPKGGRVAVDARRDGARAVVRVTDTGVGIPEEARARIFTPFERVANPLRATGTGLGLTIAKAIVERHGGTVRVESAPGKGSTFSFDLPISA